MQHPRASVEKILIKPGAIADRTTELAEAITAHHAAHHPADRELTIVPILTGAMIFAADLIRGIDLPLRINLMTVSSYPGKSLRSQGTSVLQQQLSDVKGRDVLVIDDILDSGQTLATVTEVLSELEAKSVKTCVLLHKQLDVPPKVQADYVGFEIPDAFVVGYGLDYDNLYRNLPYIAVLKNPE